MGRASPGHHQQWHCGHAVKQVTFWLTSGLYTSQERQLLAWPCFSRELAVSLDDLSEVTAERDFGIIAGYNLGPDSQVHSAIFRTNLALQMQRDMQGRAESAF